MTQLASKTITRPDFEALSQFERAAKIREGYKVVNPPPKVEATVRKPLRSNEITRATFDGLNQVERAARIKAGVRIVD
jgi:hypothetical protein